MIDSHCHLADDVFVKDAGEVIARARAAGLDGALCILDAGNDEEHGRAEVLSAAWPELQYSVGVHPHHAARFVEKGSATVAVERRLYAVGACAIGEIGLDYHYDFAPRDVQHDVFAEQLALALERDLPVVIHAREADADVARVVAETGRGRSRGVFHCFTGDVSFARTVLDLGFHVSMAGIVTFPKAPELREVARFVPDDRLLIETDSPYLAPAPHRGKRNEPAWVVRVAEVVAAVRGTTRDAVAALTRRNFERLFGASGRRPRVDSPNGLCSD
jgi:TatD DNase family protein